MGFMELSLCRPRGYHSAVRRGAILFALLAGIFVSAGVRADEASYAIHLDRASKKGDRASVEVVVAEITTDRTRWSGYAKTVDNDYSRAARMVTDFEVLQADKMGAIQELRCTIRSCTRSDGEGE